MIDVLWLTPVAPDRDGGGGHIRQAHLLLELAKRARVHLVSSQPVLDEAIRAAVTSLAELGVAEHDWSARPRTMRRLRDLSLVIKSSQPREVADFQPVRRAMATVLDDVEADIVVVEYAGLAPLIGLRRNRDQLWVLTLHNLGSVMSAQEAAIVAGRRRKWLARRDSAVATRWERAMVARYDHVVVVSAEDAEVLGAPAGRVRVVPNGVDPNRFCPAVLPTNHRLVFTGALYTTPNADGARWFCEEILPLIRSRYPDVQLDLVGARPGPSVKALAAVPGVALHADVPTVRTYLEEARVVVVPLRIGSGTRLKALEGMAVGRPVVGTTVGLGGLGLENDRHAAFADEPAAFASAVCRAISDDQWARSLAREGRTLVEERYSWSAIASDFVDRLDPRL